VPSVKKCYLLNTVPQSWDNAQARCAELGGKLAWVTSQQEADGISTYLKALGATVTSTCATNIFIGAQRDNPDSCSLPFKWKDDEGATQPLKYTNWLVGQPDCYQGGEKCASIAAYADRNLQWNDIPCGSSYCYLCQV